MYKSWFSHQVLATQKKINILAHPHKRRKGAESTILPTDHLRIGSPWSLVLTTCLFKGAGDGLLSCSSIEGGPGCFFPSAFSNSVTAEITFSTFLYIHLLWLILHSKAVEVICVEPLAGINFIIVCELRCWCWDDAAWPAAYTELEVRDALVWLKKLHFYSSSLPLSFCLP